jgi:GNAT superfamily N-acetyltransferase
VLCCLQAQQHAAPGSVLGYIVVQVNSVTAHINKLAVAPEARRDGLATRLLRVGGMGSEGGSDRGLSVSRGGSVRVVGALLLALALVQQLGGAFGILHAAWRGGCR